jgi:hypothetical protein
MPEPVLAHAVEKLVRAGEQVGLSVEDLIRLLNAGVSVGTLIDLIGSLEARRSSPWIM